MPSPDHAATILDYLKQREAALFDLLERLVNTDSATPNREGVEQVADLLARELDELGCAVERLPPPPLPVDLRWLEDFFLPESGVRGLARHVRGRLPGQGRGRALLIAHMDTAFPPGAPQRNPFRIEGGKAYGPAVADMKGGIVVIVWALRALRDLGLFNLEAATVLFDSDEQAGTLTARPILEEEAPRTDWAFVTECARFGGHIVAQRTGLGVALLETRGRWAHVGTGYETGVSAVEILARKITGLHALADPDRGVLINVGQVGGGLRRNLVAGEAWARIDVRAMTAGDWGRLQADMERVAAAPELEGGSATLRVHQHRPPMARTPAIDRLAGMAVQAGRDLGLTFEAIPTFGGSDGNLTAALGVPTLDGLGPAGGDVMTDTEWIEGSSLAERTALLATLLHRLGSGAQG